MGRWSNSDSVGPGYLSLGSSDGNPDHLFWSYATVRINAPLTCSATFIGPNVLLTAGHCGHFGFLNSAARSFNVMLYSEASNHADIMGVSSQCETLVQGIGLGDTHLVYCSDVSWFGDPLPPGEIVGMADFDLSKPIIEGEKVWTSWWNPECPGWDQTTFYRDDQCPGQNQMFFSPGVVDKLEAGGVYGADGVITTQILAVGVSGGGIWRQTAGSSHRLVSSGFSNGPCNIGTAGCGGWKAATITSALALATPDATFGVNSDLLQILELAGPGTPWTLASYSGLMDSDQNGFFDVQERRTTCAVFERETRSGSASRARDAIACGRSPPLPTWSSTTRACSPASTIRALVMRWSSRCRRST